MKKINILQMKYILLFVLILAILLAILVNRGSVIAGLKPTTDPYTFTPTDVKITYSHDSHPSFYSDNRNDFYFCTKDGLKYISADGDVKWEKVFNMLDPVMIGENDNVAVAEPGGNMLYVFSPDGMLYEKQFDQPIMYFSMNTSGYTAVITRGDADYEIMVLNEAGVTKGGWSIAEEGVYPVGADISNDGRISAYSTLQTQGLEKSSKILFAYNDKEEAKTFADSVFGSVVPPDQIVAMLKFMQNDTLITLSDTEIGSISFGEDNSVNTNITVPIQNRIDNAAFIGEEYFALAFGEGLVNQDALPVGRLTFYDTECAPLGEYDFGKKITYLYGNDDAVIAGSQRKFCALDPKGNLIWEYNATQDIKQMIFLKNTDTLLLATPTEAVVMNRTRVK